MMISPNAPKYFFTTSEGVFYYTPHLTNEDNILLFADTPELLNTLLSSLELAGVEEGRYFEDYEIIIDSDPQDSLTLIYYLEVTKADLCLIINFEILNYI